MKRVLLLIVAICTTLGVVAQEHSIIPTPRSYVNGDSGYTINYNCKISCDEELLPAASYLADKLGIGVAKEGDIYLGVDRALAEEAYQLSIYNKGIIIIGGGYGGVFNGITTLLQLLPEEVYSSNLILPCTITGCAIEDAPRFAHRGFMLDVCRTWIPKEDICAYIDLLAYHKINSLRLHLTDDEAWRIEIKSHPELAMIGGWRGGDSPIHPRYGKWDEKWGGYYTQQDIRDIVAYAAQRNIEIIPEIDLPGHSLCLATIHPEILCDYEPNTSLSLGQDVRSAICPSNEANFKLIDDILAEVSLLFSSKYIHVGGDEVDMSQWKSCERCVAFMNRTGMHSTDELRTYFMGRIADILERNGKYMAVWNDAITGDLIPKTTMVYGWESIAKCRNAAAAGYPTIIMPGNYFYFDMKQSPREAGHDWANIFDMEHVYSFSPSAVGFTTTEMRNVVGLEASFFSEAYASRNPESPAYLHYQTFPRLLAFAEVAWTESDKRDIAKFKRRVADHYNRMDAMGIYYRLDAPEVVYEDGMLTASVNDGSEIFYRQEGSERVLRYLAPIATTTPERYRFISRRGVAISPVAAVDSHFETIKPSFKLTSSLSASRNFPFSNVEKYSNIARSTRAADRDDWVMFTFDKPVKCRSMRVATGNMQLPRFIFESGDVYVKYEGDNLIKVGELKNGAFTIENPDRPISAVCIVCTTKGNGDKWVSIQPPVIYPTIK
jgi:hexosaminidase